MAIKTRYRIKNKQNTYDTIHFETSADQIITDDNKQFVSSQEKTKWNNKADASTVNQELAKKSDVGHSHSEYAAKNGDTLQDFKAKTLTVSESILPSKNGLNIGSETQRFSGIYVDEAYLSTNTLYIGDTPILGTSQDTIMIKADPDQSITMQTKNSGITKILSETGVELAADGTNTNVNIKAIGANSQVNIAAANAINISASDVKVNSDINVTGSTTTNDLTVKGNLNVLGATTTIDTQVLQVKDNIIDINKGETGSGVTAGKAGIRVLRGDAATYNILFDETDDMFKVGMDGQLETIATQPYVTQELTKKANSVHTHQASQVTFTDGKTFQEKLNDGSLKGAKGDTGAQGPQGIQGPKGDTGATGATWKPSVDSSGNLTWTQNSETTAPTTVNIKGPQGAQGIQGPQGATGPQGAKGADGVTPTIKAGTVTTGSAGSSATVTASTSGTTTTFNFTIPQGLKGDKGDTGAQGIQGPKGDTGSTGAQGPKGDTGAKGATGVSMRLMGAWNSSTAYVNNSSYIDLVTSGGNTYACKTSNTGQAVSDTSYWTLIAQKGDTGAKGATGATGATGPQGPTGATGPKGADGLTTSVTVGSTKYTHVSGNITIPAYPTLSSLGAAASSHTHNYLPLSGGTITASSFGPLTIKRSGSTNAASIIFANDNGTLGSIGMTASANGGLVRWAPDTNTSYTVLDTGNYKTTITPANIGAAAASHGTHVSYSTTAPLANGTASAGSASTVARTDHVHPLQTTVSGNAGTATKLQTARTINGTSFDGSANITTANWGTARTLTIGNSGKSVNGSGNVSWSLSEIGAAATNHTHNYSSMKYTDLSNNTVSLDTYNMSTGFEHLAYFYCPTDGGGANITGRPDDSRKYAFNLKVELLRWASTTDYITKQTYTEGNGKISYVRYCTNGTWAAWAKEYTSVNKPTVSEIGAAASSHTHNYAGSSSAGGAATSALACTGNSATATKLATARTINGTSFDGSAAITTANWGTARTITIGSTGKSVNGSANVSWTLAEIGAAASSHTHNYAGSSSAGGAATSAVKWSTARTITLSGAVTGSASIDGSANVTITTSDARPVTTITKSLTVTTGWMDTGITGSNLSTGSYMVQMLVNDGTNTSQYNEYYTGVMSWFAEGTNSTDSDEILLHKAGHASNGRMVYLRTIRSTSGGYLKLQIACSTAFTAASSITFKFRRLI